MALPLCAAEIDESTGLVIAPGWETVKNNCEACHSLKLVTSQRADRRTWLDTIRWMQETQNLWSFTAETEILIIDYLAKNYAPDSKQRRASLPPHLMPVNPLSNEIK